MANDPYSGKNVPVEQTNTGYGTSFAGQLFGMNPSANLAGNLAGQGFGQYQVTQAPDVSGKFAGTQGPNFGASGPYQQSQLQLMGQLEAAANGQGPSLAQQQLAQGADAAAANAMGVAAATDRGGNPGAATGAATSAAAQATQQAAGQSAATRVQEQLNARNELAGVEQAGVSQGLQEAGMGLGANEFNSQAQQNLGSMENANWQFENQLNANSQNLQNQYVGQMVAANNQAGNAGTAGIVSGVGQAAGSLLGGAGSSAGGAGGASMLSSVMDMLKKGGVVEGPEAVLVGEAGREAIVPVKKSHVKELQECMEHADDGEVIMSPVGQGGPEDGNRALAQDQQSADSLVEGDTGDKDLPSFADRLQAASQASSSGPAPQAPVQGPSAPSDKPAPGQAAAQSAPQASAPSGAGDTAIEQGFSSGIAAVGKGAASAAQQAAQAMAMKKGGVVSGHHVGFQKLEQSLAHQKGVKDPGALAAYIGREKYGKEGMAKKADRGRKAADGGIFDGHPENALADVDPLKVPDWAKSADELADQKSKIGAEGAGGAARHRMGDYEVSPDVMDHAAQGTVVDSPQVRVLGHDGPQMVIPIDEDGDPDMSRAKDPAVRHLMAKHGKHYEKLLKAAAGHVMGGGDY